MSDPVLVAERYEVIRPLGRGTFAHTLLARDIRLDRQVALKVLHPRGASDLKAYELFEREAAVLRDLRHPGVPAIHTSFRAQWEGADAAFLAGLVDAADERAAWPEFPWEQHGGVETCDRELAACLAYE